MSELYEARLIDKHYPVSKNPNKDALWVCWREPLPIPRAQVHVLSFMSPAKEEALREKLNDRLISARAAASSVKETARQTYINLIAQVGTARVGEGSTFRKALTKNNHISPWWFHKISEKDCETDPTFRLVTEIAIIVKTTALLGSKKLFLLGSSKEVAAVLKAMYETEEIDCQRKYSFFGTYVQGLASRIRYAFRSLPLMRAARQMSLSETEVDVAFSGFWDWSLREKEGRLADRYFKSLPEKLRSRGAKVAWFLWFDPEGDPVLRGRKLPDVLGPATQRDNLVILQGFLKAADLITELVDFRPFFIFRRFCRSSDFSSACTVGEIDYSALLRGPLSLGFLNATIPMLQLVRRASEKAFRQYRPEVAVSFLELLLYSRAFYAGGRAGSPQTIQCAIQHASYSKEKTMGVLEPEREYHGIPDGCPVPRPDFLFAMGELGREIFLEDGFPEKNVFLTGSSRYDDLVATPVYKGGRSGLLRLLVVASLDKELEMEMIDAAYVATEGISGVRLLLRSHPFGRIEARPEFRRFSDRVIVTSGTLEEDLANADLILFSYSTVAEEAFVRGIPVWQWTSVNFNGSAFRDLSVVPSFSSPATLRYALLRFLDNPSSFMPDEKSKALVLRKCFYKADGGASDRIADVLAELVGNRHAIGSVRPPFGSAHAVH